MGFPSCKHRKKTSLHLPGKGVAVWLASEPFRVFFFTGALWSIIGVSLWPLWYSQELGFYPAMVHARLMIQAFGGAFVVGFLGTAGPRMASAPRLTPLELALLVVLHIAGGVLHLRLQIPAGDMCFAVLLGVLLLSLLARLFIYRKEAPPPQLALALSGLLCGLAGTILWLNPEWIVSAGAYRMAGLLLYQGMLLLPVLGIGAFLFPRILGGEFGGGGSGRLARAVGAAVLIVGSFFLEVAGYVLPAYLIRAGAAAAYLLLEVRWRRTPGEEPRGTLARGLFWALGTGLPGLAAAGFFYPQHVGLEHLLYVGCFGLLILVVASRVLFGHSGNLEGFSVRSWIPRVLIALAFIAATTRATADFIPKIMVSHHKYAAWSWGLAVLLWLVWHRRRFLQRDEDE